VCQLQRKQRVKWKRAWPEANVLNDTTGVAVQARRLRCPWPALPASGWGRTRRKRGRRFACPQRPESAAMHCAGVRGAHNKSLRLTRLAGGEVGAPSPPMCATMSRAAARAAEQLSSQPLGSIFGTFTCRESMGSIS